MNFKSCPSLRGSSRCVESLFITLPRLSRPLDSSPKGLINECLSIALHYTIWSYYWAGRGGGGDMTQVLSKYLPNVLCACVLFVDFNKKGGELSKFVSLS